MRRRSASAAAMMRCARVAQVVDALAQRARAAQLGGLAREADAAPGTCELSVTCDHAET